MDLSVFSYASHSIHRAYIEFFLRKIINKHNFPEKANKFYKIADGEIGL